MIIEVVREGIATIPREELVNGINPEATSHSADALVAFDVAIY